MDSLLIQSETTTNFADYRIFFRDSLNGNPTLSFGKAGVSLDSPTSSFWIKAAANQTADIVKIGPDHLNVSAAGNVGIGTTAPTERLDVVGNTKISGSLAMAGTVTLKNVGSTVSVIRISPAGDIGMGSFTSGTNPNP